MISRSSGGSLQKYVKYHPGIDPAESLFGSTAIVVSANLVGVPAVSVPVESILDCETFLIFADLSDVSIVAIPVDSGPVETVCEHSRVLDLPATSADKAATISCICCCILWD